jgi:hypothetical protein
MHNVARGVLGALVLIALAACGGAMAPPGPSAAVTAEPAGEALNLALVPPPSVPGEAPRRPVSRDALAKSAAELRALFGNPTQVRREPPAEIWQYLSDTPACVLLFVLYPTDTPGQFRVQHAEALARRRGASISDPDCVAALLKTPPGPGKPVS